MTDPVAAQEPEKEPDAATLPDGQPETDSEHDQETDAASVHKNITAAVASPGNTAAKRKRRSQGRKNLGVDDTQSRLEFGDDTDVQGDVFGGQKNVYNNYFTARDDVGCHYEFNTRAREEVRGVFVKPDEFDHVVAFIEQRNVVVVRVPNGVGKRITGLRLVDEVVTDGAVVNLDPGAGLQRLSADRISNGAGYLLTGLSQGQADKLGRHDLARLDTELGHRKAKLVITVATEVHFADTGMSEYCVEICSRPQFGAVLERHLQWRLSATPGLASTILARPDVLTLLEDEIGRDSSPRRAATLARFLAEAAGKLESLVDIVRSKLSRQAVEELGGWFQSLPDLHARSLVTALAVLNGLPYEIVAEASRALYHKFKTLPRATAAMSSSSTVSLFSSNRSARLTTLRARLTEGIVHTQHGPTPAELIEFIEPAYPNLVLRRMWQEYDDTQPALVEWLRELGGHPIEQVRERAGIAVGALTTLAFDFLRRTVLVSWAQSREGRRREAAAVALDASNANPKLRTAVHNLVQEWSNDDDPRRIATAVRAYGTSVGIDRPQEAFETFERLAESGDVTIVDAVCGSLAELVESGVDELAADALRTTRTWATSRVLLRRVAGNLAFLLMAADLVCSAEPADGTAGARPWPLLLRLASRERRNREAIADMWAAALSTSEVVEVALQVLDGWALFVEDHELARGQLVRVLHGAAVNDRVRGRLRRQATTWTKPKSEVRAPRTAAAVIAVLTEGIVPAERSYQR